MVLIMYFSKIMPHTSKLTRTFFQERNIKVLSWPACSPDLIQIENAWELSRLVYKDGRQFNSKSELEDAIRTFRNNLESDFIKKFNFVDGQKMFWNNREKWKYNFILNNFLCQKCKFLLLLLTFHVSFQTFLDAEKTHFWDFLLSLKIILPN